MRKFLIGISILFTLPLIACNNTNSNTIDIDVQTEIESGKIKVTSDIPATPEPTIEPTVPKLFSISNDAEIISDNKEFTRDEIVFFLSGTAETMYSVLDENEESWTVTYDIYVEDTIDIKVTPTINKDSQCVESIILEDRLDNTISNITFNMIEDIK